MGDRTAIEWAANADGTPGATWNPIVGCSHASPGCRNCYAQSEAARQERIAAAAGRVTPYAGTTQQTKVGPVFTAKVALVETAIDRPLRRRTPTTYFVNSMGDLGADGVEDAWLDLVWNTMALAPRHTFIVLTKRPERLRAYLQRRTAGLAELVGVSVEAASRPLPNVWLGVTAEDQQRADQRIPVLLETPAAVRFISYEPAIGPLNLTEVKVPIGGVLNALRGTWASYPLGEVGGRAVIFTEDRPRLDWVICGGESGHGEHVRPMHPDWARQVRDDCASAGVPFFFKQWGEWLGVEELRRRPDGQGPGFGAFDHCAHDPVSECVRIGKRRAGRLLDGELHDARPPLAALNEGGAAAATSSACAPAPSAPPSSLPPVLGGASPLPGEPS